MLSLYVKIRDYLLAGLGLAVVLLSFSLYVTQLKFDNCKDGRQLDRQTYKAAQKESESRALQEKIKKEEEYNVSQKKADKVYTDLAAKFSATVVRLSSAQRSPGVDSGLLLEATRSAASGDGPSQDTPFPTGGDDTTIFIAKSDAMICAENTARVIVTQEWAKEVGLIAIE